MIHVKTTVDFILLLGLLVPSCLAISSLRSLPVCAAGAPGTTLQPSSSCVFDVTSAHEAQQLQLLGANGPRLPTVLLNAPTGFAGLQGLASFTASNVILESSDGFPNHSIDLATLLRPPHISGSSTAVNLTNTVLLHTLSASQAAVAVATLRGVVSDPIVQHGVANWDLRLYTDYVSYVYVGSFSVPGLTCTSCGVFLQFTGSSTSGNSTSTSWQLPTLTPDEPRPAVNYLLGVDNSTFIPSLMRYGSISSPRPFLVLLSSNITWGNHPILRKAPSGFMELNRHVVIVGQYGQLTALDLGMVANAVYLTGPYSNVTLHGVVLENQGLGDRQSGSQVAGLSIMNPFNVWIFYWPRLDVRFILVNTTAVASHQEAVQYMIYWQIMTSSSDPAMRAEAAWVQRGPGITIWESVVYPQKMLDTKFVCRTSTAADTWRVSTPLVFPQLPDNVDDPSLYQNALQAHRAAPLAVLAGDDQQLQQWLTTLSGLPREGLSMIIAPLLSLGPSAAQNWPPPGDIILKAPKTVMVGQHVCEGSSSSSSSEAGTTLNGHRAVARQMPQRTLLDLLGMPAEEVAAAVQCSSANRSSGESNSPRINLAHFPMLDWGQDTGLLQVQPSGGGGVLELNSLTLVGLSQGPGVATRSSEGSGIVGRRLAALPVGSFGWATSNSSSVAVDHRLQDWQGTLQQQQQHQASRGASRLLTAATTTTSSSSGLSQGDVRVWTHVLWAIKRAPDGQLVLRNVAMGLPKPEFKRLLAASRAAAGGAFTIPLEGGTSLVAKSSSFLDDCCLLISSYTGPGMNATTLLLFTDPDSSRSMPPGYFWPYDGSEGLGLAGTRAGGLGGQGSGLSSASLAGLVVGLCAAAVLAAVLVWVFVARQRRRQQYVAESGSLCKLPASSGDTQRSSSNSAYGLQGCGKDQFGRSLGPDGHPVADVAAIGSGSLQDQQNFQAGFSQGYSQALQRASASQSGGTTSGSGTGQGVDHTGGSTTGMGSDGNGCVLGNKRWQKLTTAISSKVQDIHQQRLRTALMQSQRTGVVTVGGPSTASSASTSPGFAPLTAGSSAASLHASAGAPHNSANNGPGTHAHVGSAAAAGTGMLRGSELQSQAEDLSLDKANVFDLKELIGRGTFGTVYRASWQGVNVAVKLLQLPPGAGCTMTESGMFNGSGGTAGLLRAVGGWSNAAGGSGSQRNLMKHEHMAVQEAAIGSCMMHPNIVSVYSISLSPSGLPTPLAAKQGAAGSSGELLLLREDGTAVMGASELNAGGGLKASAASLELLPWEMQLVMEYCDQGTLREAVDAGMLVNKASGMHDVPIVLSLAHNVACAMAYLHQEHIIHGDLKASNVLLKTCVPAMHSSSGSCAVQQQQQQQQQQQCQPGKSSGALGPVTGSWSANGSSKAFGSRSSEGSSGRPPPGPSASSSSAPEAAAPYAEFQGPAASMAIIDAAAAAASGETASGMHSLLKCGWVVAKVSDFGLSVCVKPEETHVSSVHAGTLTHMAPEMLMHGRCSKASDVYAFGILLWEVATGGKAFAGIPKPLLGHCVISQAMRPTWPPAMRPGSSSSNSSGAGPWAGLVLLTERCWAQEPQARPSFAEVVQQLARLLKAATSSQASTTVAVGHALVSAAAAGGTLSALPPLVTPGLCLPAPPRPADGSPGHYGPQGFSSSSSSAGQNPRDPALGTLHPGMSGFGVRDWFFSGLFGDKQDAGSSMVSTGGPVWAPTQEVVPMFHMPRSDTPQQQQQRAGAMPSLAQQQQQQQAPDALDEEQQQQQQ